MTVIQTQPKPYRRRTNFGVITLTIILIFSAILIVGLAINATFLVNSDDAWANNTVEFERLKTSLVYGNKLRLGLNLKKMNLFIDGKKMNSPDELISFDMEKYSLLNKTQILTTHVSVIDHAVYGPTYQIIHLTLKSDNALNVKIVYLDYISRNKVLPDQILSGSMLNKALIVLNQTPLHDKWYDIFGLKIDSYFNKYFSSH